MVRRVAALSVQLYSVRTRSPPTCRARWRGWRELGFEPVEPFDLADPNGLRDALAAAGLSAPSVTRASTPSRVLEAAATIGAHRDPAPHAAGALDLRGRRRRRSRRSWRGPPPPPAPTACWSATTTTTGELASRLGGRSALEHLAERLPARVVLELDTYWAAVGEDVPALLGRLGDRVRLLHLKDGPISEAQGGAAPAGLRRDAGGRDPRGRDRGRARGARVRRLRRRPVRGARHRPRVRGRPGRAVSGEGPLRVGVVGAGKISEQYLANMAGYPDLDVRFVADLRPEVARMQAEAHGVPGTGPRSRRSPARTSS